MINLCEKLKSLFPNENVKYGVSSNNGISISFNQQQVNLSHLAKCEKDKQQITLKMQKCLFKKAQFES
jgi:hypothetical protein